LGVGAGGAGDGFSALGGRKKASEWDNAVGSPNILVGDGTADGGFMNSHGLSHLAHGERMKSGRALGEVVGLAKGNDLEKFL